MITFSKMTLSTATSSIITLREVRLSITSLIILTFSIVTIGQIALSIRIFI
jgi:hypothetical protein